MSSAPSLAKGTRDFTAQEIYNRRYIIGVLQQNFELFGFQPLETPSFENLSTLTGKYGEEGDRLIFKILNSGNFTSDVDEETWQNKDFKKLTPQISDKALRYDLTVPFARFVAMNHGKLSFPFKRYQIQPVWRADRPQKGRFREFYQCDADVVGSDSLLNEVELMQIIDEVFKRLQIRVCIKINNRKVLSGIAEVLGAADKLVEITVAMDKLDKIGWDSVKDELMAAGLDEVAVEKLQPIIELKGENSEKLAVLRDWLSTSPTGLLGVDELAFVFERLEKAGLQNCCELDQSLARGLNYYTGCIFEVKALDVEIGSITGGGRYDNLTGIFGLPGLSGVGISFGADRIYDVLNQLDLYPAAIEQSVRLLFINFGEAEADYCLQLARQTRAAGISTEVFPDSVKMKKQMSYANARNVPYVALVGADEMRDGTVSLKDMVNGEQKTLTIEEVIRLISKNA